MYSNLQVQCKATRIMKSQVNMTASKETNQAPITDPKETETYELSDKEIKIILLKKASKLQEHTDS